MSFRALSRAVTRTAPRTRGARRFASSAETVIEGNPNKAWLEKQAEVEHHAAQTTELWRKISFYVAVPATILTTLWVRRVEEQHAEHEAHIRAEHDGHLPEKPEYDYLNRRTKPFPWGVNVLFFNPHTNKDMSAAAE